MEQPFKPFTLTHVVRDISEMRVFDFWDRNKVSHYNVPWGLKFQRNEQYFGVLLKCERDVPDDGWSIKVKFQIILSSTSGRTYKGNFETTFTQAVNFFGANNFINSNHLFNDFILNDEVIVEAEVTIMEMIGIEKKKKLMSFDDEDTKKASDAILCVGDEKFHVLKQVLARQSPYFHSMFFRNFKEANMPEIPLEEVSPEDFQCFLEVINLEPALSDDCVENVLRLSDMYEAKNVTRQCEEFLMHKSWLSDKKKLQLVARYDLKNLMDDVFDNLRTKADIRAATDPEMTNPEILKRLLDMALRYQY